MAFKIFSEIVLDKSIDCQLIQIVNKYDTNFDKEFNYDEFQKLARSLGVDPKLLILDIDVNHDGIISQEEVFNYLKKKTSGEEMTNIYSKYATKIVNGSYYEMSPKGLQKFFNEIQDEPISELEAYQLVIYYLDGIDIKIKRKINKKIQNSFIKNNYKIDNEKIQDILKKVETKYKIDKLKATLSLREFNNMLNSHPLTVYKIDKFRQEVDLDRPLTDYFINSTHNTYITGHQLSGTSSSKMYSLSLLEGYRLVELDCYNGSGDDIIITHGYTLVSDLKLDDVLKELLPLQVTEMEY